MNEPFIVACWKMRISTDDLSEESKLSQGHDLPKYQSVNLSAAITHQHRAVKVQRSQFEGDRWSHAAISWSKHIQHFCWLYKNDYLLQSSVNKSVLMG